MMTFSCKTCLEIVIAVRDNPGRAHLATPKLCDVSIEVLQEIFKANEHFSSDDRGQKNRSKDLAFFHFHFKFFKHGGPISQEWLLFRGPWQNLRTIVQ